MDDHPYANRIIGKEGEGGYTWISIITDISPKTFVHACMRAGERLRTLNSLSEGTKSCVPTSSNLFLLFLCSDGDRRAMQKPSVEMRLLYPFNQDLQVWNVRNVYKCHAGWPKQHGWYTNAG